MPETPGPDDKSVSEPLGADAPEDGRPDPEAPGPRLAERLPVGRTEPPEGTADPADRPDSEGTPGDDVPLSKLDKPEGASGPVGAEEVGADTPGPLAEISTDAEIPGAPDTGPDGPAVRLARADEISAELVSESAETALERYEESAGPDSEDSR